MKVSIFGGSGFVGDYLINELIKSKYNVYTLVRLGNKHKIKNCNKIKVITGEIDNPTAMEQTMINTQAVIYNIGIIRERKSYGDTFERLHFLCLKKCVDMAKKLNIKTIVPRLEATPATKPNTNITPITNTPLHLVVHIHIFGVNLNLHTLESAMVYTFQRWVNHCTTIFIIAHRF